MMGENVEKSVEELQALKEKHDGLLKELTDSGYDFNAHPHVAGIIKDNQSERKIRQEADTEVLRLRDVNATLQEELAAKAGTKKEEGDPDDEEFVTFGGAKKMLAKASEGRKESDEKRQQAEEQRKFFESEQEAKVEFTKEKCGEGLDYSSVLQGYRRVVQKNPAYFQVMRSAKNPAKQAYEIGLLDPEIAKLVEASKNVKLLDKMKSSGKIPKGVGGSGTGVTIEEKNYEQLLNTPTADLMKSLEEAEKEGAAE